LTAPGVCEAKGVQIMQLVGLVVPPDFEVNSFAPLTVLEAANQVLGERRYVTRVLSEAGGPMPGALGIEVVTQPLGNPDYDTLLVAGGSIAIPYEPALIEFLQEARTVVRRIAAIRLGAFPLAEAGLLDGRRATTHWAYVDLLRQRFPLVDVEDDSLFVEDGSVWTSAGMAAGVDLAMCMLERDVGADVALEVARLLVMGQRRHACAQQRSGLLDLAPKSDRVQKALTHARAHLRSPLTVEELAQAACLSPRQFGRVFLEETGCSPARAVEKLRLEAARLLVSQGRLAIETIADETGFGDAGRMRRAFARAFGKSPGELRRAVGPHISL
jgi:transcriptional regulator GlxA family with amidase domain